MTELLMKKVVFIGLKLIGINYYTNCIPKKSIYFNIVKRFLVYKIWLNTRIGLDDKLI